MPETIFGVHIGWWAILLTVLSIVSTIMRGR